ncbi:class D beta-lactamase [Arcobacter sp. s6]|jgi:beta-lactamase class D|uniref:class D beta-lactamase n=1 Tax=Arcobacter sp. s6 TaxID=3230363 RepID=UPI00349FD333
MFSQIKLSKIKVFLLGIFISNSFLFASDIQIETIFKNKNIEGTLILESLNTKKTYIYNEKKAETLLSPASTFKIPHTLIALNEGVISADSIILWDKTDKGMTPWNKDQTLESAFKVSCVWCYKEFTSKIAASKYKEYLEKLNYGNKTIGIDVSDFWLDGSLKITALGQIDFLKKLYKNDLPFKMEYINTLKNIMIEEKNENYTLSAKSGWSTRFEFESGWYIGYIETKDDVWFFATNIVTHGQKDLPLRKGITLEALKIKGIIN